MPAIFRQTPVSPPDIFREVVAAQTPPDIFRNAGGPVLSVFGRTGAVVAQPGDYAASQVTNAVNSTQPYADPPWIASLGWVKITGAPSVASYQTPWAGDIDAAGHKLTNVSRSEISVVNVGTVVNNDANPWLHALQLSSGTMSSNSGAYIGYRQDGLPLPGFTFTKDDYAPYSYRWCKHTIGQPPQGNGSNLTQLMELTNAGALALPSLPSVAPAAGSKQLYYDPADGNRVKFMP